MEVRLDGRPHRGDRPLAFLAHFAEFAGLVELALDPTGGHGMGGDMSNRDMHMIYYEFIKRRWRL